MYVLSLVHMGGVYVELCAHKAWCVVRNYVFLCEIVCMFCEIFSRLFGLCAFRSCRCVGKWLVYVCTEFGAHGWCVRQVIRT